LGARLIRICVVDQRGEVVAAGAIEPRLFERLALLVPAIRDVEIAETVRTEQPLVADGNEEIRAHFGEVERIDAERLARIHNQRSVVTPRSRADANEIDHRTVRPMTA